MKRFLLTDEHIKLLRAMYVEWDSCEFGAPAIDSKRPYGNSGYRVFRDIAKIIGDPPMEDHWESFPAETETRYENLHYDTRTALQIVLRTGQFEAGWYATSSDYTQDWTPVKEPS
jgi:hypothetical protein